LATASEDHTARIWDVQSGQLLHLLDGHPKQVWDVRFSPDGRRVATACDDLVGRVWDVATGGLLFSFGSTSTPAGMLRYTPDGRRIFSSSLERNIRIWDAKTGTLLDTWPLHNSAAPFFGFSPDGSRFVAGVVEVLATGWDVPSAEVWDVEHGRDLLNLRGHTEVIMQTFFSSDGCILSGSMDTTMRQWETFPWQEAKYPGTPGQLLRNRIATYAREYWRERLGLETEAARRPPAPVQPLKHWERSRWPKRDERAGPNQIDLTEHYTGLLGVSFFPHPGLFDNHLRTLPSRTVSVIGTVSAVTLDDWDGPRCILMYFRIVSTVYRLHILLSSFLILNVTCVFRSI
jgi:hypothetical protein